MCVQCPGCGSTKYCSVCSCQIVWRVLPGVWVVRDCFLGINVHLGTTRRQRNKSCSKTPKFKKKEKLWAHVGFLIFRQRVQVDLICKLRLETNIQGLVLGDNSRKMFLRPWVKGVFWKWWDSKFNDPCVWWLETLLFQAFRFWYFI
jgi:hypothetical protein